MRKKNKNRLTRASGNLPEGGITRSAGQPYPAAKPPSLIGQKIGEYLVEADLSSGGGMGIVLLCRHKNGDIAVLKTHKSTDKATSGLFKKEADNWLQLEPHPSIVSALTLFTCVVPGLGEKHWLVLEYIPGFPTSPAWPAFMRGPFSAWNNRFEIIRYFPKEEILRVLLDICSGMAHIRHSKLPAHGDLKPDNLLVSYTGRCLITDFGLSGMTDERYQSGSYTAPEVKRGTSPNTTGDVYSFGAIIKSSVLDYIKDPIVLKKVKQIQIKCQKQSPEMRYQDFGEISAELGTLYSSISGHNYSPLCRETDNSYLLVAKAAGKLSFEHPDYIGAETLLLKAQELNHNDYRTHEWLGYAYCEQGKWTEAIDLYKSAIKIAPDNRRFWMNLGRAFANQNMGNLAAESFSKAFELSDNSVYTEILTVALGINPCDRTATREQIRLLAGSPKTVGYIYLSLEYDSQNRTSDKLETLAYAIRLEPDNPLAHVILGESFFKSGKYDEAISEYQKAIQFAPAYATAAAYTGLGVSLKKQGKSPDAIDAVKNAIQTNPDYPDAHYTLALLLKELGNLPGAEKSYRETIRLDNQRIIAYYGLIEVLEAQKKHRNAIDIYRKCIEVSKEKHKPYVNLGALFYRLGEHANAIDCYNKAIEHTPNEPYAYNNLGIIFAEQGNLNAAEKNFLSAVKILPGYASPYNSLGIIYSKKGRTAEAIEAFNKAINLAPQNSSTYYNLGRELLKQDQLDEAIRIYNKAYALSPTDAVAFINLGAKLKDHNKISEAIDAYKKAIAIAPQQPETYANLGRIYILHGDIAKARENLKKTLNLLRQDKALLKGNDSLYKKVLNLLRLISGPDQEVSD